MPTKEELEQAIYNLENAEASYEVCLKLAVYHSIMDIYYKDSPRIKYTSDTEFMDASKDVGLDELFSIMDELMECLKLINPRLYNSVITKLTENKK